MPVARDDRAHVGDLDRAAGERQDAPRAHGVEHQRRDRLGRGLEILAERGVVERDPRRRGGRGHRPARTDRDPGLDQRAIDREGARVALHDEPPRAAAGGEVAVDHAGDSRVIIEAAQLALAVLDGRAPARARGDDPLARDPLAAQRLQRLLEAHDRATSAPRVANQGARAERHSGSSASSSRHATSATSRDAAVTPPSSTGTGPRSSRSA